MYRALPETVGLFGALPQVFHNGQASLFRMHDAGRDTLFSLLLIILFFSSTFFHFPFSFLGILPLVFRNIHARKKLRLEYKRANGELT
jgi:integral membrane sensor domain MASE1